MSVVLAAKVVREIVFRVFTDKESVLVAVVAKIVREISEYLLKDQVFVTMFAKVWREICEYLLKERVFIF